MLPAQCHFDLNAQQASCDETRSSTSVMLSLWQNTTSIELGQHTARPITLPVSHGNCPLSHNYSKYRMRVQGGQTKGHDKGARAGCKGAVLLSASSFCAIGRYSYISFWQHAHVLPGTVPGGHHASGSGVSLFDRYSAHQRLSSIHPNRIPEVRYLQC